MWEELGISGGTAIIILIALYFIVKWAVKNGIKEAYTDISGKKPVKDIQDEKEWNELMDDTKGRSPNCCIPSADDPKTVVRSFYARAS